jgi:hypothetical protein
MHAGGVRQRVCEVSDDESRVCGVSGPGEAVRVGVESTGNTRYFKGRMESAGVGVTVINTLKFKVVNESVTIAEFLKKDMLPESRLCSEESEQL